MAKEQQPDFAMAMPVETSVKSNGKKQVVWRMMATSKKAAEEAVGAITEEMEKHVHVTRVEGPIEDRGTNGEGSGRAFGFSRWNTPWNPKGPKPNWVQPENPSRN